jgi:hypothetical protein
MEFRMRIFISWPKESKSLAEFFGKWIADVIQQVEPWISSRDLESGSPWFGEVSTALSEIGYGVVFVTKSNFAEPWLMFETGALQSAIRSRVTPVFCNLEPFDVSKTSLYHLMGVTVTPEGFFRLVTDINNACIKPLPLLRLKESFDRLWPDFDKEFKATTFEAGPTSKPTIEERWEKIDDALQLILQRISVTMMLQRPRPDVAPGFPRGISGNDPAYLNVDERAIAGTAPRMTGTTITGTSSSEK